MVTQSSSSEGKNPSVVTYHCCNDEDIIYPEIVFLEKSSDPQTSEDGKDYERSASRSDGRDRIAMTGTAHDERWSTKADRHDG